MKARPGTKGKTKSNTLAVADNLLESNQRMAWIEQGGIDLRAARDAMAKKAPKAKPAPKKPPKAKPAAKKPPKAKPAAKKRPKAKPTAKRRPKARSAAPKLKRRKARPAARRTKRRR